MGDAYDFVCSVHQDRDHLHMHLIFNSVRRTGGKYHYKKGEWNRIIKPLTNCLEATDKLSGRQIPYRASKGER